MHSDRCTGRPDGFIPPLHRIAPKFTLQPMKTIHAIYADGVFHPVEKVELPERSEVEFEPRPVSRPNAQVALASVYDVLDERFQSGESGTAARHDEHQP